MFKIRKGDTVEVIKGKDKGKKGKVLKVFPVTMRLLVEGVNMVKKHKRQTRQDQAGGIISIEMPLGFGSVMAVCKSCNRPTRVGFTVINNTKGRFCKRCKESL